MVESIVNSYSNSIVENRLSKLNVNSEILNPINIETKSGINESGTDNSDANKILGMLPDFNCYNAFISNYGSCSRFRCRRKGKRNF